ncbi:MAG: crosslink repair DNA glycosylase YcaQ family protein [Vicinamibacterales bacterium]
MKGPSLDALRRHAVARSLFRATTLQRALNTFGFVQADPIRAPARAQDLTLRHRVTGYRAGMLEQRYAALRADEDVFINYGFVTPALHALMHPRGLVGWPAARRKKADELLAFVRARVAVHPREVEQHFAHGQVTNYWGGSSNATTHLLDQMHYAGLLKVVRRDSGVRVYGAREPQGPVTRADADARLDALVDLLVGKYSPLPGQTLSMLVRRLRYAVPQLRERIAPALQRAKDRLDHARLDGTDWYWPPGERPEASATDDEVRLLAPFDPIVWDRRRFELFWGWAYRFEAYTPVAKRTLGYYALPMLWRDRVIGWGNVNVLDGALRAEVGYLNGRAPAARGFAPALDAELGRLRFFLGVG